MKEERRFTGQAKKILKIGKKILTNPPIFDIMIIEIMKLVMDLKIFFQFH